MLMVLSTILALIILGTMLARGYFPLADDDIDRAPEGEVVHIEEDAK